MLIEEAEAVTEGTSYDAITLLAKSAESFTRNIMSMGLHFLHQMENLKFTISFQWNLAGTILRKILSLTAKIATKKKHGNKTM
jgi:hypothetical protein